LKSILTMTNNLKDTKFSHKVQHYYLIYLLCNDYVYFNFFMCVNLNSLFDRSIMKVCYVTQLLKQRILTSIKKIHNYILKFRNIKSHLLQACLGAWTKIETVIEKHVC